MSLGVLVVQGDRDKDDSVKGRMCKQWSCVHYIPQQKASPKFEEFGGGARHLHLAQVQVRAVGLKKSTAFSAWGGHVEQGGGQDT